MHFRRRFTEVRIGSDAAALATAAAPHRPGRGLRAARPVDGGSHSRQWHVMTRAAEIDRRTAETDIHVTLSLDGDGAGERDTGVGFFDHMLDLLARHGRFDLTVQARGDLQTGAHHTVEDVGICLGPGAGPGARRPRRHPPLRPGDGPDGREPRLVRDRHLRTRAAGVLVAAAAGGDRQLRPRADRGVLPRAGRQRPADAAPHGRGRHQRPPRDRGDVQGLCAGAAQPPSRSIRPSTACPAPRGR